MIELAGIKLSRLTKKRKYFLNNRVQFIRPKLAELNKQGFMCIDMHCHSSVSDGNRRPSIIMKKAQKYGFGLSLTDHNAIKGSLEIHNKGTVPVILGIEVSASNKRDFLLYFYERDELKEFYEKYIKDYRKIDPSTKTKIPMERILNVASNYNCIISAAHPFGYVYKNLHSYIHKKYDDVSRDDFISRLNAIEAINGTMTRAKNIKATKWAISSKKAVTGGSDGHTLGEIGSVVTAAKTDSASDFLDMIRKNESYVIGRESSIRAKLSAPGMMKNHFKHYPVKFKDKTVSLIKGKKLKRKVS